MADISFMEESSGTEKMGHVSLGTGTVQDKMVDISLTG